MFNIYMMILNTRTYIRSYDRSDLYVLGMLGTRKIKAIIVRAQN